MSLKVETSILLRADFTCYAMADGSVALLHTMSQEHLRNALSPFAQMLMIGLPAVAALLGGLILGLQCVLIGPSPWPDNSVLV